MLSLNGEGAPRCVNSGDAQGIAELASATVPHKTDRTETQAAPTSTPAAIADRELANA